ncbi:MAG: ATP-binding cassette domain-containing protein [Bacteroidia bacterium]|nr:ATP-binding cassette domain-containing protein [Bacteroidia bacterium]
MKPILEINNVCKKFHIHGNTQPYLSLRENLFSFLKPSSKKEEFWALKDVSFNVMPGDTVGIIGKNGAGKSTLLKILSKITPPTSGSIISRGRIASLLEVGTGFHPELSGKENIFLNGSILGMRRHEINKQLDAIVDFSGVEKFLNTPLKHYSSGMQLRLAFAVASFLEPEILIIDEVLAVGDAEFQKKCLGKMEDVSKSGRTILFVSHSINALQSLCKHGLLINQGISEPLTDISTAVNKYLHGPSALHNGREIFTPDTRKLEACIYEVKLLNDKMEVDIIHETCNPIYVEITWENVTGVFVNPSIELHNYFGVQLFCSFDTTDDWFGKIKSKKGKYKSIVKIPGNFLKGGDYFMHVGLYCSAPTKLYDIRTNILNFMVVDPMDERCIARGHFSYQFDNFALLPALDWQSTYLDNG